MFRGVNNVTVFAMEGLRHFFMWRVRWRAFSPLRGYTVTQG
jgi:hypothetical protein